MAPDYFIPDTSADIIMDVSKILANSPSPMTIKEVSNSFAKSYSATYITWSLIACCQLGLATENDGAYLCSGRWRDDIKRASKEQLYIIFQACLKDYPPFLLYIDFACKGYDSAESAARTRGILRVKGTLENVEKSLRRWGIYARLVEYDKVSGNLNLKVSVENLSAEYVARLLKAFEAELKVKVFLLDMLGPEVFAYLDQRGIKLDGLTSALLNYEADPKTVASKATQTFELFLWRLGEDIGVNVTSTKGPIELADAIRGSKQILGNQNHLAHGIGGIRNMTHHDPDKETGQVWTISKQGALLSTLLVPASIRSLYLYYKEKRQEF